MEKENIAAKLTVFLSENFLIDFGKDYEESTNLFKVGFIDSFGIVELVCFLEAEFGIKVEQHHLESDALMSFEKIIAFVMKIRDVS